MSVGAFDKGAMHTIRWWQDDLVRIVEERAVDTSVTYSLGVVIFASSIDLALAQVCPLDCAIRRHKLEGSIPLQMRYGKADSRESHHSTHRIRSLSGQRRRSKARSEKPNRGRLGAIVQAVPFISTDVYLPCVLCVLFNVLRARLARLQSLL